MKHPGKFIFSMVAILSLAFFSFHPSEPKVINVVIDAGHGGHDEGSAAESVKEKEITAAFASEIKRLNANNNVIIHFTRSGDDFVELTDRTNYINKIKPDLVISLHTASSTDKQKSGVELYLYKNSLAYQASIKLATKLRDKLVNKSNLKINEINDASFMVLKNSNSPAITVELGYLSNEQDKAYLTNPNDQERIARTILEFINEI
ncbi:MAG TPA: N-acetylmuramoyl-L-alanine amidase [Flavobacterium sp.]|jgi:N-acetylmuramoyl-L-alanine amidase